MWGDTRTLFQHTGADRRRGLSYSRTCLAGRKVSAHGAVCNKHWKCYNLWVKRSFPNNCVTHFHFQSRARNHFQAEILHGRGNLCSKFQICATKRLGEHGRTQPGTPYLPRLRMPTPSGCGRGIQPHPPTAFFVAIQRGCARVATTGSHLYPDTESTPEANHDGMYTGYATMARTPHNVEVGPLNTHRYTGGHVCHIYETHMDGNTFHYFWHTQCTSVYSCNTTCCGRRRRVCAWQTEVLPNKKRVWMPICVCMWQSACHIRTTGAHGCTLVVQKMANIDCAHTFPYAEAQTVARWWLRMPGALDVQFLDRYTSVCRAQPTQIAICQSVHPSANHKRMVLASCKLIQNHAKNT